MFGKLLLSVVQEVEDVVSVIGSATIGTELSNNLQREQEEDKNTCPPLNKSIL